MLVFGHPSTGSAPEPPIELTHIGVYFKECASQKTQKYSVSRQYRQFKYSQKNLGTLISGLICDSKLIFRAFLGVNLISSVIPFCNKKYIRFANYSL